MTKQFIKKRTIVILLSILLLGFVLRFHNYTVWPRLGATFDEYAWTWLGINLIQEQIPSSWSSYSAYEGFREHKEFKGADFWITKPYLEHPPLFGLLVGGFAVINGATGMFDVELEHIRPLALILGILSIAMLFLLVKELYDEKVALLASLIYAIVPTVAIGSRLVQNENFFIPSLLLALFLISRFIKSKDNKYFIATALICGFLILAKMPWIAAGVSVGLILLYSKKYKHLGILVATLLVFLFIYLIYGYYYNWDLFISLWQFQLERYEMTFTSMYTIFTEPFLADRFLIDGWIYFGWFAFVLLLTKKLKNNYILIFGLLGYLLIYVFSIPDINAHGWYRYPFYPFLIASIALFIKEYFNKNYLLTFLFLLFVGLALLESTWGSVVGFSFPILRVFILALSLTLLPLFFVSKKIVAFSRILNFVMLIFVFSLSIGTIFLYNEQ